MTCCVDIKKMNSLFTVLLFGTFSFVHSIKCYNGGTIIINENFSYCECPSEFFGTSCKKDVNECLLKILRCMNGATCVNNYGGYSCECVNGWEGKFCDINIDDCSSNPCSNGVCINNVGSFQCVCPLGKTGLLCEMNDPCVDNPCLFGSTCRLSWASGNMQYVCECPLGYSGKHCEQEISICKLGNPCLNDGICIPKPHLQFECSCNKGFEGLYCQTASDACAASPCLNNEICISFPGYFIYRCTAHFIGQTCEEEQDYCIHHQCLNGGQCFHITDKGRKRFTCKCPVDVEGKYLHLKMSIHNTHNIHTYMYNS